MKGRIAVVPLMTIDMIPLAACSRNSQCCSIRLQKLLLPVGDADLHLIYGSFGPTRVSLPNGISIASAVSAEDMRVTNTQTERPRYARHL